MNNKSKGIRLSLIVLILVIVALSFGSTGKGCSGKNTDVISGSSAELTQQSALSRIRQDKFLSEKFGQLEALAQDLSKPYNSYLSENTLIDLDGMLVELTGPETVLTNEPLDIFVCLTTSTASVTYPVLAIPEQFILDNYQIIGISPTQPWYNFTTPYTMPNLYDYGEDIVRFNWDLVPMEYRTGYKFINLVENIPPFWLVPWRPWWPPPPPAYQDYILEFYGDNILWHFSGVRIAEPGEYKFAVFMDAYWHHMDWTEEMGFVQVEETLTVNPLPLPPTVVTNAATNVTYNSATLNGTVNPNGLDTAAYFEWGLTDLYGYQTPLTPLGSGTTDIDITADLSDLLPETTYNFRLVASNSTGTTYGVNQTFTTLSLPVTIPNAPSDLGATPTSSSQVNLLWTDNSNNETGFIIVRKTRCTEPFVQIATVDANVTTYSDTNLIYATNYYYRVKAYNEVGNSDYTNEAAAMTFVPTVSTPDEINQMVYQYYQDGLIRNYGIYNSLSAKLNAAQNSINTGDYKSAMGQLNALINELHAQIDKSIDPYAAQSLIISVDYLKGNLSFRDSLPTTLKLYILNEEPCDNRVNILLPTGETVYTTLAGNWTIQISPTDNPDIASVTFTHSEYIGTPLVVSGVNSGALYFSNDTLNPSIGTLDLRTGKMDIIEKVLVRSSYADLLGVSPVALDISETGTFFPMTLTDYRLSLNCRVDILGYVPFLGDSHAYMFCRGCDLPSPEDLHCQPLKTDPNLGNDVDGDGKADEGFQLEEVKKDDEGNATEMWATPDTFRWRYVPITGTPVWIGACKIPVGGNNDRDWGGSDNDNNGRIDVFTSTVWYNIEGEDGPTTTYEYNPQTGNLTITKYNSLEDARAKKNPIGEPITKPAPTDLEDLDPPGVYVLSTAYPFLYLVAELSGPPIWEYTLNVVNSPKLFKPGDILEICGVGITSASVGKEASKDKFGAWRVKEIRENLVVFEVTQEVTVREPITGFSITAPNTIEGIVRWLTPYNYDITLGPVGVKD